LVKSPVASDHRRNVSGAICIPSSAKCSLAKVGQKSSYRWQKRANFERCRSALLILKNSIPYPTEKGTFLTN
jgi:hypothetical protein